jgi:hypothetical protein
MGTMVPMASAAAPRPGSTSTVKVWDFIIFAPADLMITPAMPSIKHIMPKQRAVADGENKKGRDER